MAVISSEFAQLCICATGSSACYMWQLFFQAIVEGDYMLEVIQPFLDQLPMSSGYMVCPGIGEYLTEVCFKTKHLREWGLQFTRLDSQICLLWHLSNNSSYPHGHKLRNVFTDCRRLNLEIFVYL